ncbi:MAG: histidine kinase [Clostridia bacterium]|nr:histidine kinase [Clostridia bacterium]
MTDEVLIYLYFFAGGALLLSDLFGIATAAFMPGLNKKSKFFFISSFFILTLSVAFYVIDLFVYTDPDLAWTGTVIAFFETFLPSLLMPLFTAYVLDCCGESKRKSPLFITAIALCATLFILLVITQFTKIIYYFTPDNRFVRGNFYPLLILPMVALVVVNLVGVLLRRRKLNKKNFVAFLIYLLPLLVSMVLQAFINVFLLIVIAVSISAVSMYAIILSDQVDRYLRQQREIANQQARIAVLQMRPHFIYNTMMSIYYLCKQDPEKAQQVTLDFTTYLRKNFSAIVNKDTIPFAEELKHTRAYLSVVQAQCADNLIVEFDTPHTLFRVPPLSLQPLVENAVKYGLDPDSDEPLHIFVKTEESDSGIVIAVEDNGPGISTDDNGEPHVALDNIRERLSAVGATLNISLRENGGTVIRIFVPNTTLKD